MKNAGLISILLGFGISYAFSQDSIVSIPDTAFLHALIDYGVDNNRDSLISYAEAETVTKLNVSGGWDCPSRYNCRPTGKITSFEGIEAFIGLDTLLCGQNKINSLDLSSNSRLIYLDCNGNSAMRNLNINQNFELKYLDCSKTYWFGSLNVTNNANLSYLDCSVTNITELNVSHCVELEYLDCSDGMLPSDIKKGSGHLLSNIDVSKNKMLKYFDCSHQRIQNLDLSVNIALDSVDCTYNWIVELILPETNTLKALYCGKNHLTDLNVSSFQYLEILDIGGPVRLLNHNELTSIDLSNNPILRILNCKSNLLTDLDVSNNPALEEIYCMHNQLDSLDVSGNPALEVLYCNSNLIQVIDISSNPMLRELGCGTFMEAEDFGGDLFFYPANPMNVLDISNNPGLEELDIQGMHELYEVCVWTHPFPPESVTVDSRSSPNVYFTTDCTNGIGDTIAPQITIVSPVQDSTYGSIPEINITIEELNFKLARFTLDEGTTWSLFSRDTTFTPNLDMGDNKLVVFAEDSAGNISMDSVSFTIGDIEPPTIPTGLVIQTVYVTSMIISWNPSSDNTGVTGYIIYVDGNMVNITTITSYNLTALKANTTYDITVSAFDADSNESERSAPVIQTTLEIDSIAPSAPDGLQTLGVTDSTIQIAWTSSLDNVLVTGYNIYLDNTIDGKTSTNSYSLTGLSPNTSYSITVSAFDEVGNESDYSDPIQVTTLNSNTGVGKSVSKVPGDVKIYPNPTFEYITIEAKNMGHFNLEISSINGQVVHNQKVADPIFQLDLSSFYKGVYIITIWSKDFLTTRKIIRL